MTANSVLALHTTCECCLCLPQFQLCPSQRRPRGCGVGGPQGQSYPCHTHQSQSTPHTHLHDLLQVLGRCTEAVGAEVLHNHVDPLTSAALARCEHTVKTIRSGARVARTAGFTWVRTHTRHVCTHARTHALISVRSLAS